jgi:hypothetical protein
VQREASVIGIERRWVSQLLGAFAPTGGPGLAPLPNEVDYVTAFTRMLRHATPLAAIGMRAALWMAALAPLWLWGRLSTVSKLAGERRSELLRQLLSHRAFAVRELTLLLKLAATMALLGTPSVRARSGYDSVQAAAATESGMRVKLPVLVLRPANDGPLAPTAETSEPRDSKAGAG